MMVGYFTLRPMDSAPVWRPLAPPADSWIVAAATANGVRVWGTQHGADQISHLVYVDLPQA
jgi:hypothetical protein